MSAEAQAEAGKGERRARARARNPTWSAVKASVSRRRVTQDVSTRAGWAGPPCQYGPRPRAPGGAQRPQGGLLLGPVVRWGVCPPVTSAFTRVLRERVWRADRDASQASKRHRRSARPSRRGTGNGRKSWKEGVGNERRGGRENERGYIPALPREPTPSQEVVAKRMDARIISAFTRVVDALCPRMTGVAV